MPSLLSSRFLVSRDSSPSSSSSSSPSSSSSSSFTDPGLLMPSTVEGGNDAGAAGDTSGSMSFSTGAMAAVIVVVVVVILIGVSTASLFYIAKKREWTVRETIRRSTRKVANALTPRRTEFPREVKESMGLCRGRSRRDDIPPTPRLRPEDLEKGMLSTESKPKVLKLAFK